VALSVAGLAAPTGAEAAAPPPPAQLSITLTDGVTQVHSNTDVTYTTKVINQGSRPVTAELVLSTPTYVTITHAAGAKAADHAATWRITVRPGRSVSRTTTAHIGAISKTDYRVTTVASLYPGKATTGVPLIRTAVANTIAGVTDPARTVTRPASHPKGQHASSSTNWLVVIGGPALAVVLLAAAVLWWRRRRGGRGAGSAAAAVVEPPLAGAPEESAADPARLAPAATGRHHAADPD
jgi:LPXTG-motif cell wall-anchored protein